MPRHSNFSSTDKYLYSQEKFSQIILSKWLTADTWHSSCGETLRKTNNCPSVTIIKLKRTFFFKLIDNYLKIKTEAVRKI